MGDVPEVLFVCIHNAGRSQMAAALLDRHAAGRVRVRSAGSDPGERVNPAVVQAMAEIGLDLTKEFPKPLTDEAVRADLSARGQAFSRQRTWAAAAREHLKLWRSLS